MVEGFFFLFQRQHIRHLAVHAGRAQRAPEGNDQGTAVIHTQFPLCLLTGQLKEILPYRRTGDNDLFRMLIVLAALLKAHHDAIGKGFQHFRGQAGHHIGFMHCRGNASLGRRLYHGVAGIAAGTDDHIRPKLLQNRLRLTGSPHQIIERTQIVLDLLGLEGAMEAGNMHGAESIACLGHQILFQSPLRTHKQKFRPRVLFGDLLGQRNGRVDMARRAAAGEDHAVQFLFHMPLLITLLWQASSGGTRTAQCPFPPAGWKAPCRRS